MSETRSKPPHSRSRHRRRRSALVVGVPLALASAGAMAYDGVFGVFGADAQPKASAASGERPQLTDAQATGQEVGQEVGDWLGDWTPTAG
ncbi:hypothetical protein [Streptomyces sp. GQFP]|uniref:hypothetical protein n=1 Tax=Streptomyces sp. GQFP TaxID=2907545 RepID=UPI002E23D75F